MDTGYLINEYCTEGDLGEKLNLLGSFPECIVKVLMIQIFNAVLYLHSRRIIHGDIKLENIMIDSTLSALDRRNRKNSFITSIKEDAKSISTFQRSFSVNYEEKLVLCRSNTSSISPERKKLKYAKLKNFNLKLIDFGCSKIFTQYKKTFEDTIGTLLYCAPEVLKNNYNEKCDIWSCGIIMYVLLSGEYPFVGHTEKEITQKILNGNFTFSSPKFENVSENAKDLIKKCLIYDRDKRISIKEILNHPFFTEDIDPNNIFQEQLDCKDVLTSLQSYSKHSKFYQALLAFLSHNFAEKDYLDRIKKIFYTMDLNLDGKKSKEELKYAYCQAGIDIDKEQLEKIIDSVDFDNNGYIEYEEFIRVIIPTNHYSKKRT